MDSPFPVEYTIVSVERADSFTSAVFGFPEGASFFLSPSDLLCLGYGVREFGLGPRRLATLQVQSSSFALFGETIKELALGVWRGWVHLETRQL